MILIDAIYINNGGGKVLLDYLIEELEKMDIQVHYLLDRRIKTGYNVKRNNRITYLESGILKRVFFYQKFKSQFTKIFVLGNVPPPLKLYSSKVYTYFHNSLLLSVPEEFTFIEKFKYVLKVKIIRVLSSNTDHWLLQSATLKEQFENKFGQSNKIMIVPFFPTLNRINELINREKNTFIYVSNAQSNKNHSRLINAFCRAYDASGKGKLILTVNDDFQDVIEQISTATKKGYPIENIGFVNREILTRKYMQSEYVIFPSLAESFGLGLIEGVILGCKILGADLPYTFAVVKPSLTFNPKDENSIEKTILSAMQKNLHDSIIKTQDNIIELINLLK